MSANDLQALAQTIHQSESAVVGLRSGLESQLHFFNPKSPTKTRYVVMYLHGFSASPQEVMPLPAQVAAALGANLFMPRLNGHGLNGKALAKTTASEWRANVRAAYKTALQLGDELIVLGTSTGATLGFWLALNNPASLAALLLVSPNFATRDPRGEWLRKRWGRLLFRVVRGPLQGIEPLSAGHSKYWTTFFPVIAIRNLLALITPLREADFSVIKLPVFVAYSEQDEVVDTDLIEQKFAELGGEHKRLLSITTSTDPLQHVIVGDIRSPNTTALILKEMLGFLAQAGVSRSHQNESAS